MNVEIVNKHGGVLNWTYRVPSRWNELHLKLWFRDQGLEYPPWTMIIFNQTGLWLCMSPDIDYLDRVASKVRLTGAWASVHEGTNTVTADMRPLLAKERAS